MTVRLLVWSIGAILVPWRSGEKGESEVVMKMAAKMGVKERKPNASGGKNRQSPPIHKPPFFVQGAVKSSVGIALVDELLALLFRQGLQKLLLSQRCSGNR